MIYLAIYVISLIILILIMAAFVGSRRLTRKEKKDIRIRLFAIPSMITLLVWAIKVIF